MKIAIVGTGYVGLPTAVSFAEHGNEVTCIDTDSDKVELLSQGIPTIHEKGLPEALEKRISIGNLRFTDDYEKGLSGAKAVFCTVGTPENPDDGSANMEQVYSVAKNVGSLITNYTVFVNKSTVPMGTARAVTKIIKSVTNVPFDVVSNPEFMAEGRALDDVRRPSRIIIGTDSARALEVMEELYHPFVRGGAPIRVMSPVSAEMSKYAANGYLATKLSYYNELASLALYYGADIEDIRRAMGDDPRIGRIETYVGPGWGGSCFPKDTASFIRQAEQQGFEFQTMRAADEANNRKMQEVVDVMVKYFEGDITNYRIALWGLAFKKNTDDMRISPAIEILKRLLKEGAQVSAFDEAAGESAEKEFANIEGVAIAKSKYDALNEADALIIATDWEDFTNPDTEIMKKRMKRPIIFDWRNMIDLDLMRKSGFYYQANGRPPVIPD